MQLLPRRCSLVCTLLICLAPGLVGCDAPEPAAGRVGMRWHGAPYPFIAAGTSANHHELNALALPALVGSSSTPGAIGNVQDGAKLRPSQVTPPPTGTFHLRPNERKWLATLSPLRLGFSKAHAPVAFEGRYGGPNGIIEDYLRPLEELGLRLQPVPGQTWEQTQKRIRGGEIDLYIGPISGFSAADSSWSVSRPFVRIPYVIVMPMRSESVLGLKDLAGMRVAIVGHVVPVQSSLSAESPTAKLVVAPSPRAALSWLNEGKVDAFIANLAIVDPLVRDNYPGTLRIAAPTNLYDSLGLATHPRYSKLVDIFNRMIDSMPASEHQRIRDRWLVAHYGGGVAVETILKFGLPILLAFLAALGVYGASYRRLRKEIDHRSIIERRLHEVTHSMPAVVYRAKRHADGTLRFPYIAGDMHSLFGTSAEEVMADSNAFFASLHEDDVPRLLEAADEAESASGALDIDFRARSGDGWRWIHSRSRMHRSEDGTLGWNGYWIDVTHAYAQAEELAKAKESSEQAAAAKADFLATMSHEIRTPISGILGMLERLGHTALDNNQRRVLDTIEDSAEVLSQIIDDILEFSKMEARALELEQVSLSPRVLADHALLMVAAQAHAKGLALRSRVDFRVAAELRGDPVRLRQILFNLLSNAVKFTESGKVCLDVRVLADVGTHQRILLSVSDTGVGIADELQSQLFEPFVQANASIARSHGGTGLGLAICRRLVALMSGEIRLRSRIGVGTTVDVEIELPVLLRQSEANLDMDLSDCISLADQELSAALHDWLKGLSVCPPTGALHFADGPADLRGRRVLVVDRPVSLADDELAYNPILSCNPFLGSEIARICALLTQEAPDALRGLRPDDTRSSIPPPRQAANGRVLVAEDHPTNQELIRWRLEQLGYECEIVGDGRMALEALASRRFDALITDCQMPHMDGYELAIAIRSSQDASLRGIPIVALTARVLEDELQRCKDVGMDVILTKPVKIQRLRAVLEQLMSSRPSAADVQSEQSDSMATMARNFISPDVARQMLCSLATTTHEDLAALRTAWDAGDMSDSRRILHRMAGALRVVGAESLAQDAMRMHDLVGAHTGTATFDDDIRSFYRSVSIFADEAMKNC